MEMAVVVVVMNLTMVVVVAAPQIPQGPSELSEYHLASASAAAVPTAAAAAASVVVVVANLLLAGTALGAVVGIDWGAVGGVAGVVWVWVCCAGDVDVWDSIETNLP
jgi:hypothetical protein